MTVINFESAKLKLQSAKLKKHYVFFKVIDIDQDRNVIIQNWKGERIIIDCLEWADISVFRNHYMENPYWPPCEADFSDGWDSLSNEEQQKIDDWDKQRLLRYNPLTNQNPFYPLSMTDFEIVA